jgi:hypothetical protein
MWSRIVIRLFLLLVLLSFLAACSQPKTQSVNVERDDFTDYDSLCNVYSDTLDIILINRAKDISKRQDCLDDDYHKMLYKEYYLDTAKIWNLMSLMIDDDYSTVGMNYASYCARLGIGKLISKYYKKIQIRLIQSDSLTSAKTHKSWIKFKDNEVQLNRVTHGLEYGGLGTIQTNFQASRTLNIYVERLESYYGYLLDMESVESFEIYKRDD